MTNIDKNCGLRELNFPPVRVRARREGGKVLVWSIPRARYVALSPEEWVRIHVVNWLVNCCNVAPVRIAEEYSTIVNSQPQRADIVVFDLSAHPLLVVECKAASVALSRDVVEQAYRYNSVLDARYVMITNGISSVLFESGSIVALDSIVL